MRRARRRFRLGRIARSACLGAAVLLAACGPALASGAKKRRSPPPPPPPPQWEQLEESVSRVRRGFRGKMAVYIEDLQTGRTIRFDEETAIPAASLIKVPIAVAAYEQVLQGKLDLSTEVALAAGDKAAGSGILKRYRPGTKFELGELMELMLQRSDNTATNILTDQLGLETINASCREQGLAATCMPRYIMDLEARDRKIENTTSASDMARLLRALYQRKILDGPSCDRLLEILKGQHVRDRLPRYLPKGVVVAHKTGLMNHLCHDAGIIYGADRDYLVAVLTADFPTFWTAKNAIGQVGRLVYLYDQGKPLTIQAPPAKKKKKKRKKAAPPAAPVRVAKGRK